MKLIELHSLDWDKAEYHYRNKHICINSMLICKITPDVTSKGEQFEIAEESKKALLEELPFKEKPDTLFPSIIVLSNDEILTVAESMSYIKSLVN